MFSKFHVEEIRKRAAQKRKRLANTTVHGDGILHGIHFHGNQRKGVNVALNVARHLDNVSRSSTNHCNRLSIPVKLHGQKESKLAFRKEIERARLIQEPSPVLEIQALVERKPMIRTTIPNDITDCHRLCLPEWLLKRLEPIWEIFRNLPQPTTDDKIENLPQSFTTVRGRLREAKSKLSVDLDEMFSQLGLNVKEIRQVIDKSDSKQLPKTPQLLNTSNNGSSKDERNKPVSNHPTKSQILEIMECLRTHEKKSLGVSNSRRFKMQDLDNSDGPSASDSISEKCGNLKDVGKAIPENLKRMGIDEVILKLCDLRKNTNETCRNVELSPMPNYESTRRRRKEAGNLHPQWKQQPKEDSDSKRKRIPHLHNDSPKQIQHRIGHSFRQSETEDPFFSWAYRQEATMPGCADKSYIADGQIEHPTPVTLHTYAFAPVHPMWDTPDELKTSTHFSLIPMDWMGKI